MKITQNRNRKGNDQGLVINLGAKLLMIWIDSHIIWNVSCRVKKKSVHDHVPKTGVKESRDFPPINHQILLKFKKLPFFRNLRVLLITVGTNIFFISSAVLELLIFKNLRKSPKKPKISDSSEISKIRSVQIIINWVTLMISFNYTSKILTFWKNLGCKHFWFGFYCR